MPAPDINRLQVAPEELLTWLDHNLLMAGLLANVPNPPGTAWATIQPAAPIPARRAVNLQGQPMDVFELRSNGVGGAAALPCYVCNYLPNAVHSVVLGAAGDYCFTTTLNGCTFGIGPRQANGTRRVSHANQGGNSLNQRADTWGAHGAAAGATTIDMLEPASYRRLGNGANLNATVFGIRSGFDWRFYFQLFTAVGGGNYQVHGVFPIQHR